MDQLPVERHDGSRAGAAQFQRGRRNGVEDRLYVLLRTTDHAQDLARRGLLFQGLGEVAIAGFQFLEQAYVLDGDHGLVGEGLQQANLPLGEFARHGAYHHDGADHLPFTHHGNAHSAAESAPLRRAFLLVCGVGEHILDLHRLALQDHARRHRASSGLHRISGAV